MGFNSVYQTLKELFPQVDARILKAVAIEHSKDPDVAVESILTEVLPFINNQSHAPTSNVNNHAKVNKACSQSSSMLGSIASENAVASDLLNIGDINLSLCLNETVEDSIASSFYDAKDSDDHLGRNSKNEELIAMAQTSVEASQGTVDSVICYSCKDVCNVEFENHEREGCFPANEYQDARVDLHDNNNFPPLNVEIGEADAHLTNGGNIHPNCNCLLSHDVNASPGVTCHKEQPFAHSSSFECQDAIDETLAPIKDNMQDALDLNLPEPEIDILFCFDQNKETSHRVDVEFVQESAVSDSIGAEETILSTHMCKINLIQKLIENAKGHKGTLFSTMKSVKELIKEVEFREKVARQANDDAKREGLKILEKVEEIKNMLKHAKEANDMHAGEVYGEKSILATEVKELQIRLLGLSDEKERSCLVLDEMQRTLEARLVLVEEERKIAEQETLKEEGIARSALEEQELIMERVVHESKLLQQEAEENAKLREFLMEKGRIVDILQGEFSVICEDVKLLKENFDNRISTGKPPFYRQASSPMASSNSIKSMGSDPAPEQLELFESASRTSRASSIGCQTPRSTVDEELVVKARVSHQKELLDEDWELFDY